MFVLTILAILIKITNDQAYYHTMIKRPLRLRSYTKRSERTTSKKIGKQRPGTRRILERAPLNDKTAVDSRNVSSLFSQLRNDSVTANLLRNRSLHREQKLFISWVLRPGTHQKAKLSYYTEFKNICFDIDSPEQIHASR